MDWILPGSDTGTRRAARPGHRVASVGRHEKARREAGLAGAAQTQPTRTRRRRAMVATRPSPASIRA